MSAALADEGVRVLVVAGDPLARAGLVALLATNPGCSVVGQVAPVGDLVSEAALYHPDVVLFDLAWEPAQARSS